VPSDSASAPAPTTSGLVDALHPALAQKLETLPVRPGCYLVRGKPTKADPAGEVLYVGKAKSLRARVRQYFQEGSGDVRYFIPILRRVAHDLDTIVTSTEKEAAILENALIKQHRPRYNVKLRDDKEFLSLRLDERPTHDWPRLTLVRKPAADGATYFGPYHSATAARRSLHLVNKHFQLRTCTDQELASRSRPCLQHQIKRCAAPCVFEVDRRWYGDQVRAVSLFLSGRHDELSERLHGQMARAATETQFELAAIYRDQLRAVTALRDQQRVVQTGAAIETRIDVVGVHREGELAEIIVLYVRGGRVVDTASFTVKDAEIETEELIARFLDDHYGPQLEGGFAPPDEILLPVLPEAVDGVAELLSDRAGHKVQIFAPQRGPRAHLVAMATDNARHGFQQNRRGEDDLRGRLAQLGERLRLPSVPRRIECCDISHLGGGDTVGAIVALVDGQPAPKRYKAFHVKGVGEGDDYAAMYQVLARRFRRGKLAQESAGEAEGDDAREATETADAGEASEAPDMPEVIDGEWVLPDLFVVDGGKGQLAVALAAAHDLGLHELPIIALAKEKTARAPEHLGEGSPLLAQRARTGRKGKVDRGAGEEGVVDRVYLPEQKNPIELREHSASMFFLARARDEAHRFANRIREKRGQKKRFASKLDQLRGIGEPLRKELVRVLGSYLAIERASDEALLAVPGFGKRHLTALRKVIPAPSAHVDAAPTTPSVESAPSRARTDR
jgi:excinuclease ABC subunit C